MRAGFASLLVSIAALACSAQLVFAGEALPYLESVGGKSAPYLAPSKLDDRFTIALYVNVGTKGPNRQRMWVLHRDKLGGEWRLGMWDRDYWKSKKLTEGVVPPFSWLISSGRVYRGDRSSGPTPAGIYGIDERPWRYGEGYLRSGMIHVMHIDLHKPDGRVTGVAFHGTTRGNYRQLGSNESHGCIRMHQKNALALLHRLTGLDGEMPQDVRWGEVPRYWQTEEGRIRQGYTTDGQPIPAVRAEAPAPATVTSTDAANLPSDVLVKSGFRAIAIIFQDDLP